MKDMVIWRKLILQNIWWPAIGNFDHLHPEYEVSDFRDGTRFLDFAWLPGFARLNVEGDGLETHARKISRTGFDDDRIRQNHLIIDGWSVLRFTHDMVKERPRMCQQMLLQFMGKLYGKQKTNTDAHNLQLSLEEKEILRLAFRLSSAIRPQDVSDLLNIESQKSRKLLHRMSAKEILLPAGDGNQRIKAFRLSQNVRFEDIDF